MKRITSAALAAGIVAAATTAAANEIRVTAGLEGAATSWDDDGAAYLTLGVGYVWRDFVAAEFTLKAGAATIDDRAIQHFAAGGRMFGRLGKTRPFARAAVVHQHEISRDAVKAAPVANLLGWGDGIRHRGGGSLGAGVLYPFKSTRWGNWFAEIDLGATGFTDKEQGPRAYWGLGAAVGLNYHLGSRRHAH